MNLQRPGDPHGSLRMGSDIPLEWPPQPIGTRRAISRPSSQREPKDIASAPSIHLATRLDRLATCIPHQCTRLRFGLAPRQRKLQRPLKAAATRGPRWMAHGTSPQRAFGAARRAVVSTGQALSPQIGDCRFHELLQLDEVTLARCRFHAMTGGHSTASRAVDHLTVIFFTRGCRSEVAEPLHIWRVGGTGKVNSGLEDVPLRVQKALGRYP